jgi:hypothetical protein
MVSRIPKPQSVLGPIISSGLRSTRTPRPTQDDNKWRKLDCRQKQTRDDDVQYADEAQNIKE